MCKIVRVSGDVNCRYRPSFSSEIRFSIPVGKENTRLPATGQVNVTTALGEQPLVGDPQEEVLSITQHLGSDQRLLLCQWVLYKGCMLKQ
jgi:hypothetical protein